MHFKLDNEMKEIAVNFLQLYQQDFFLVVLEIYANTHYLSAKLRMYIELSYNLFLIYKMNEMDLD